MINNQIRIGSFTSSEIADLTTKGKDKTQLGAPAKTYIKAKNYERRLGRSLNTNVSAKPMQWGNLVEPHVFAALPIDYSLNSQETIAHTQYGDFWVGSPDGFRYTKVGMGGLDHSKIDTVIDIKCPFTHLSFCDLVEPLYNGLTGMDAINAIRDGHKEGDTYYWQLVSNAILSGADHCELIVYMPYLSEIDAIRLAAEGNPECSWMQWAADLPYLNDEGYYKNINVIRFTPPAEDRTFLEDCVVRASKMLIDRTEIKTTV